MDNKCGAEYAQLQAFTRFLTEKGFADNVRLMLENKLAFAQVPLGDGLLFAGREIVARNEFLSGDFIVIGATVDYKFFVMEIKSGAVGKIPEYEEDDIIPRSTVTQMAQSLDSFLCRHMATGIDSAKYVIPNYFDVDSVCILRWLSDHGLGRVAEAPMGFVRWAAVAHIPRSSGLYEFAVVKEMPVGCCTMFTCSQMMEYNTEERRTEHPCFLIVGLCPDGSF